MKKLIKIFAGLMIMVLIIVSIHVCIQIYNYASSQKIQSVLIQPSVLWQNRIESPIPLAKISDTYIRNQLISRFVSEYLSINPDTEELNSRDNKNTGTMRYTASSNVIAGWTKYVKPELIRLANNKIMQQVVIDTKNIELRGDYFVVPFYMKTWNSPNNLDANPMISSKREMYLKLYFNKKVRTQVGNKSFNAGAAMDKGLPPFAIFEFVVVEVMIR